MARKTNYAFERNSRAKAKAEKREAKNPLSRHPSRTVAPARPIPRRTTPHRIRPTNASFNRPSRYCRLIGTQTPISGIFYKKARETLPPYVRCSRTS